MYHKSGKNPRDKLKTEKKSRVAGPARFEVRYLPQFEADLDFSRP